MEFRVSKPLTVRQMVNRLQKLVDEGHGSAPVLNETMNPAVVRFVPWDAGYIGRSPYDSRTYARSPDEPKTGTVIV